MALLDLERYEAIGLDRLVVVLSIVLIGCYALVMAGTYTAQQLAMLEAQVAHFASDDHIRAEVAVWRDASPTERLAELAEMCAAADELLAQLSPDELNRVLTREPLPDDSLATLAALRNAP
ncbi:MAG TPA: hypothetical protein VIV40_41030 [Kofleriaceae bacterium]